MTTEPTLSIVIDVREVELDETVTGTVRWANLPTRALQIVVLLGLQVSGAGSRHAESLASVAFRPAATGEEQFSLVAPLTSPPTFHGDKFAVEWLVRARIETRWAIDVKAETAVTVLPVGMRMFQARRSREIEFPRIIPDRPDPGHR